MKLFYDLGWCGGVRSAQVSQHSLWYQKVGKKTTRGREKKGRQGRENGIKRESSLVWGMCCKSPGKESNKGKWCGSDGGAISFSYSEKSEKVVKTKTRMLP